jgi:hypothetical protein
MKTVSRTEPGGPDAASATPASNAFGLPAP